MIVSSGHRVTIEYRITSDDDDTLDSSEKDGPLEYEHGAGEVFSALEEGLLGASIGDTRQLRLSPQEGYGVRHDELIQWVPLDVFEDTENIEIGQRFEAALENGQVRKVEVKDLNDKAILVDGNHPLAGLWLNFDVEVIDIKD